jgi:ubiquinone/menaquinone biosynthesis C-methylase UbiE
VGVGGESIEARSKRRRQRALFDGVAGLYDTSRRGYPRELVELMVTTAGLGEGGRVLEVGCGTGQLTEQLARHGCDVTAIDIGPSMVAVARRRLGRAPVRFAVVSFEDFEADDGAFDLVVSATAFHWVDPEVKFDKTARLLRPGGWLALLATGERYDDPFGTALLEMWVDRSDDGGAWVKQRKLADTQIITSTGLFGHPLEKTHAERISHPAEVVIGVESTRAMFLSWDPDARLDFTDQMRRHLYGLPSVDLTQQTTLTMAAAPTDP